MELVNITDISEGGKKKKKEGQKADVLVCAESADGMTQWMQALQVHCCSKEDLEVLKKMQAANDELRGVTAPH